MKTVKFASKSQRLAFMLALAATKICGMSSATKHDIRDEFARFQVSHDDAAHSPEIDEVETSAPEVVENLFDREPVAAVDGILNRKERRQLKRDLEAYRRANPAPVALNVAA